MKRWIGIFLSVLPVVAASADPILEMSPSRNAVVAASMDAGVSFPLPERVSIIVLSLLLLGGTTIIRRRLRLNRQV